MYYDVHVNVILITVLNTIYYYYVCLEKGNLVWYTLFLFQSIFPQSLLCSLSIVMPGKETLQSGGIIIILK